MADGLDGFARNWFVAHGLEWEEPDHVEVATLLAVADALTKSRPLVFELEDARRVAAAKSQLTAIARMVEDSRPDLLIELIRSEVPVADLLEREGVVFRVGLVLPAIAENLEGDGNRRLRDLYLELHEAFEELVARLIACENAADQERAQTETARRLMAEGVAHGPDYDGKQTMYDLVSELPPQKQALLRAHAAKPRDDDDPRSDAERAQVSRLGKKLRSEFASRVT